MIGGANRVCRGAVLLVLIAAVALTGYPVRGQGDAPDLEQMPVLFRREAPPTGTPVSILMVGDVSFARNVQRLTDERGIDHPLSLVAPWLRAADLTVGNYEGVIAADGVGERRYGRWRLRARPEAAPALARAGFDLLTLANNHTMDWGPEGLAATQRHLREAGLLTVGAGPTREAARRPLLTTIRGVRIAWLAFTLVPDPPDDNRDTDDGWSRAILRYGDVDSVREAVEAARPLADALIVQFHWGDEYVFCPNHWQTDLGRAAIDAGASLVIAHHPHVIQRFGPYGDGFIAYSLGNFLFDQDERPGMAVWIRVDRKGVIDVRGLSLRASARPQWDAPRAWRAVLTGWCGSRFAE